MPGDLQPASAARGITCIPAAGRISHAPAPRFVGFWGQGVSTSHQGVIKGTTAREDGIEWEKCSSAGRVISSMASVYLVAGTEIFWGEDNQKERAS